MANHFNDILEKTNSVFFLCELLPFLLLFALLKYSQDDYSHSKNSILSSKNLFGGFTLLQVQMLIASHLYRRCSIPIR